MKRWLLTLALAVAPFSAYAGAPGIIQSYVGVCDPDSATHCIAPNSDGSVDVTVVGGGGGGTSSAFGSAFPADGTAAGFSDGTNMRGGKVFDLDSGAGSDYIIGMSLRFANSGGSVAAPGDATNGLLVDLGANNDVAASQAGTWTVQPGNTANTTPWLVTGSGSAGAAAAGVLSVQGIASMTPLLANPGTAANWGIGAAASAVPANAQLLGFRSDGGLAAGTAALTAPIICGDSVAINTASSGNTELVALTSSETVYVCGYTVVASGTVNVSFITGTGTACATGETALTGAMNLLAGGGVAEGSSFFRGMKGLASNAFCIKLSGAVQVSGILYYTKF